MMYIHSASAPTKNTEECMVGHMSRYATQHRAFETAFRIGAVWEIANNNPFGNPQREHSWGHGTQKPVECMRRSIANNSRPGQAIYDPFLGSGTLRSGGRRPSSSIRVR